MRALALLTAAAGLASCNGPHRYDSSNPVHCLTIFSLASAGATATANTVLANEMNARMAILVESNGGAEWIARVTPEAQRLAGAIESSKDASAGEALFEQCDAQHPVRP